MFSLEWSVSYPRMGLKAIILAAGRGTRMKSDTVKVAHTVCGKPILQYVLETVRALKAEEIYIVVGHQADLIKSMFKSPDVTFVMQEQQLGTGHAVMQTEHKITLNDDDNVIVLAGDCPLIKLSTLQNLAETHQTKHASGTILTVTMDKPGNYGRILRDQHFTVMGIREAKDCNPAEYAVKEINTGVYLFNGKSLFNHLKSITTNNAQKEYYLTDVLHLQQSNGEVIAAYCDPDDSQAIGVNTRADLALIHKILFTRKATELMDDGVTLVDPGSTFIDYEVEIGHDTIIEPFTVIKGHTHIGPHCHIQSHSYLKDVRLDAGTVLTPCSRLTC